jgi:ribulose-phosphate 3-epimerase
VSLVQIDVMDGKFVKARSWPYFSGDQFSFNALLEESEGLPFWDSLDYEVDLMVSKPEEVIDDWITAGARRLIVHIESTDKMQDIVDSINKRFAFPEDGTPRDIELGIALNVDTPISAITGYLEDIDFVQFMGIQTIGLQGQPFDERVLDKIREFHNAHPEIIISVDGGVNFETAPLLIEAGVKRLVSGSTIFDGDNIPNAIEHFKRIS